MRRWVPSDQMFITHMLHSGLGAFWRNILYISYYNYRPKFDTEAATSHLQIDALDPSQSLHKANFLHHLPLVTTEPTGVEPFPEHLEEELNTYLLTNNNRKFLSSRRRWEMREILNYPQILAHILFNTNAGRGEKTMACIMRVFPWFPRFWFVLRVMFQ